MLVAVLQCDCGAALSISLLLCCQGDIEKVASQEPKELTQLFEQISGSDVLARPYDEAAAAKARAEEQAALLFTKKKAIASERKQKKDQKDEAERHLAALEELVRRGEGFLGQSSLLCLALA